VVFDTFKNSETLALHKDVTVVVNDGTRDAEGLLNEAAGCSGDVRYHEARGDFSVASSSRAKVVVGTAVKEGGGGTLELSVLLDARNAGDFTECAVVTLPPTLDAAWLRRVHLGVTASTGQLADNHDVLSLDVFGDADAHDAYEQAMAEEAQPYFKPGDGITADRFARIEIQLDSFPVQRPKVERSYARGRTKQCRSRREARAPPAPS